MSTQQTAWSDPLHCHHMLGESMYMSTVENRIWADRFRPAGIGEPISRVWLQLPK
jgi:hypothetical protein